MSGSENWKFFSHNTMPTLDMEVLVTCKIFHVNEFKERDCCLLIYCTVTVGSGLEVLVSLLQFLSTLVCQWQSERRHLDSVKLPRVRHQHCNSVGEHICFGLEQTWF